MAEKATLHDHPRSGGESESKPAPKAETKPAETAAPESIGDRHAKERGSLHTMHADEHRAMNGNHLAERKEMLRRHEKAMQEMNAHHEAQMAPADGAAMPPGQMAAGAPPAGPA